MQGYVDWFAKNGNLILTILSSGAVLAVLGFIARMLRRIWQEFHGRGRVKLLRNSRDPLVTWIEQVQERIFPPDECDPAGVLGRRIDRSRFDWLGRPQSDEVMIAIVYLKGRTPVAYLSAEYFRKTGGIFFWYIVSLHDEKYKDALSDLRMDWSDIASVKESISPKLIARLLKVCSGGRGWRYVIAEVDSKDANEARKKVGAFQRAASDVIRQALRRLRARLTFGSGKPHPNDPRVFKLEMPFAMPLHDADMLDEAEVHESPGWLVFAPRTPDRYKVAGGYEIAGDEVRSDLLRTLVLLGYRSGDSAFDAYLASFYERLSAKVPERVRMIHNRNVMNSEPVPAADHGKVAQRPPAPVRSEG